ncbi:hypothetical protein BGX29_010530 [Mortierella sp. GBA35]|nr:hypothetical protein BGX29_010530 [Mortierella sp. GBA35]
MGAQVEGSQWMRMLQNNYSVLKVVRENGSGVLGENGQAGEYVPSKGYVTPEMKPVKGCRYDMSVDCYSFDTLFHVMIGIRNPLKGKCKISEWPDSRPRHPPDDQNPATRLSITGALGNTFFSEVYPHVDVLGDPIEVKQGAPAAQGKGQSGLGGEQAQAWLLSRLGIMLHPGYMAKEITKAGRYGTPVDAFVFAMLLHYVISARLLPEGKNLIKRWLTAKSLFKKLTYENPGAVSRWKPSYRNPSTRRSTRTSMCSGVKLSRSDRSWQAQGNRYQLDGESSLQPKRASRLQPERTSKLQVEWTSRRI